MAVTRSRAAAVGLDHGQPIVEDTEFPSERGYDAGKKIQDHKPQLVGVTAASVQDRDGAKLVLEKLDRTARLKVIWADGGYAGELVTWVRTRFGWELEIKKLAQEKGFHLVKQRWIVERAFGWLGRYRLLAKDYAATTASSEAEIQWVMTHLMLKRLATQVPQNEHKLANAA